jgi:hypothetical protein
LSLGAYAQALTPLASEPWSPSFEAAVKKSRESKLSEDRQWLLLGHYKKNILGQWKSEVIDPAFFLSKEGVTNPQAELEGTLKAIWDVSDQKDINQDPRCRFPARLQWLKKKLDLQGPPEDQDPILQHCTMYKRYRAVIRADSLSFVFSSYYANSPGSAFGHTFFRINKKAGPDGTHSELLDHGVGYAAQVTVSNPMLYAIFGLTGFFNGVFTNLPYYYKVREYNDFESRDLWSYDLNLTPEEVDMVARHLWEVGNSYFAYYFFTQNCAYHMLTVLEAAAPRYHLVDRVPLYVIPSDSIKAINEEPGLVTNVQFRPSIRSVFVQRYNRLNYHNQEVFRRYMKDLNLQTFSAEPEENRVLLTDTTLDYLDVIHPESMLDPSSDGARKKNQALQTRAAIALTSDRFNPELPETERPELGHGSARVGVAFGRNYLGNQALELNIRFALHDLLDSHLGYPEYSQLEFFNLTGQFDLNNSQARLNNFDIFRVAAMNPWSLFQKKLSWRIYIGANRFKEGACDRDCLAAGLGFGSGYAIHLDRGEKVLGYALLEGQAYYDVHFNDHPYKLAAGPTLGLLLRLVDRLKWSFEGSYFSQAVKAQKEDPRFTTELRYNSLHNWNFGLRYNHETTFDESFLVAYLFF